MVVKVRPLFQQLILTLLPARLLLVIPVDFDWGTGQVKSSKVGVWLSLFLGSAYYTFHTYNAYYQMVSNEEDTNFVTLIIDSYNQYAGCNILMVIIISSCYHQSKLVELTELLHGVDEFLGGWGRVHGAARFMGKYHLFWYAYLAALVTMEYFFCIMFIKDRPTFGTFCYPMCYYPMLVRVTTEITFCVLLVSITNRLSMLQSIPPGTPFRGMKRAFDSLLKARHLLNATFTIPIFLLTFHQFTAIVTLSYDFTVSVVKYDFKTPGYDLQKILVNLESSGGWCLFFITEAFVLCLLCHRYVIEHHRAGTWLMSCLSDMQVASIAADDGFGTGAIRWTQLQLVAEMQEEASLTACGLIHVDLQLFYNMMGVITTYLIILVQFDVAQRQTAASSVATNP